MKLLAFHSILLLAVLVVANPASANHPGEKLDEKLSELERYFQAVDTAAAPFSLADAVGSSVRLADLADNVLILHFAYTRCPSMCPLHAEKLAEVQSMVNQSAMKDVVRFITITTDPEHDTVDVLKGFGADHGFAQSNWTFLTKQSDQPEGVTRDLARSYGLEFTMIEDGLQMHGVVTFVIDRNARLAAKFHGLDFDPLNLVLYVNGLINKHPSRAGRGDATWWDWLSGMFQ